MFKWLTLFVICISLNSDAVIAEEPISVLKVGDLVHLDLMGEAAQKYADLNGRSIPKTETVPARISTFTIVRRLDDDSEIYIEHELETVVNEKCYLCTLKGTLPSKAIFHEPVLDLTPTTASPNAGTGSNRTIGHNKRIGISDFSAYPKLKLQRWLLVDELAD